MTERTQTHDHVLSRLELLPALDGLRGLAAALVVLTHAAFLTGFGTSAGLAGHLLARGDFGVAIFFALSGFLLHRSLTRESLDDGGLNVGAYAVRRVARIIPAYWLALLAVVIVADPDLRLWVLTAFGLQIYVGDMAIPAFGQSWSIATEASFYVALPFVVLLLGRIRRRSPGLPLALLVATLVLTTMLPLLTGPAEYGENLLLERWLPWRAPHFLIGMLCAEALLLPHHRIARTLKRLGSDAAGCLLLAGAAYLASTTPMAGSLNLQPAHGIALFMRTLLATIVAAGLLLPLALGRSSVWSRALAHPFLRWLGLVSYGLFLWHLPVFTALYAVSGAPFFHGGLLPLLAVGLPISLLLATLSHQLVELPTSRLASRVLAHRGRPRQGGGERHSGKEHQPDASLDRRPAE